VEREEEEEEEEVLLTAYDKWQKVGKHNAQRKVDDEKKDVEREAHPRPSKADARDAIERGRLWMRLLHV